jgi:mannose-6-phosphate isomerase-like protein (cupin superfamily)
VAAFNWLHVDTTTHDSPTPGEGKSSPANRFDGASAMKEAISPVTVAASLTEHWSPRVVAELDDAFVKVAKVQGTLAWHSHENEDELFYILKGSLTIEMEAGTVVLCEGEAFVVPKGVRHNPIAQQECLVMLIERKSTLHTGNEITSKTRSVAEQLRPL